MSKTIGYAVSVDMITMDIDPVQVVGMIYMRNYWNITGMRSGKISWRDDVEVEQEPAVWWINVG
jgi:hypothetical protein